MGAKEVVRFLYLHLVDVCFQPCSRTSQNYFIVMNFLSLGNKKDDQAWTSEEQKVSFHIYLGHSQTKISETL